MTAKKEEKKPTGLDLMREPFKANQISKLPKQAKWMTDKKDEYTNCNVCGGWHHPKAVHFDYVGHAALTDRLLDCDPQWNWEFVCFDQNGNPVIDGFGGLWIKLTVCGVTRYGYGHPDGKKGGDAIKESIGDALRNAAMRFGAALDLWHKGDLHGIEEDDAKIPTKQPVKQEAKTTPEAEMYKRIKKQLDDAGSPETLKYVYEGFKADIEKLPKAGQDKLNEIYGKRMEAVSQAPFDHEG